MDFNLSREQKMVRDTARRFAEDEVKPMSHDIDQSGEYPWEVLRKMAKLNMLGLAVPKKYGGAGVDSISYAMVIEEIARVCASTSVIIAVHNSVCCYPIYKFGTDRQKEKFLKPLAQDGIIGGFALTEPGAGSDAGAVRTTAVPDGDHYVLNGDKIFITSGTEADILLVIASTDLSKGTKGLSTFIVEKGTPGFTYGTTEDKMGVR
ncbi:MAG: acyl-CoA dehydrogenase family protein, partial [Thermoplasmata archaeon]|nr:acyl-CoA dehydrogenase family protein [Thermoplasmata archaeon]